MRLSLITGIAILAGLLGSANVVGEEPSAANAFMKCARIAGDAQRLHQVVLNLVGNAIKYCSMGDNVTITATTAEDAISVGVSDTGPGIPAEALPHLFERFFRARNAIRGEIPGSGVGLYIVKSIVEELGGRVGVESVYGEGSTFEVWLPEPGEEMNTR